MKNIYFLFEIIGVISCVIGYILLNLKTERKIVLVLAIALFAIGLILMIGSGILEKYMWWTSFGW